MPKEKLLNHEIFILDANLAKASSSDVVFKLVPHLLKVLKMEELGALEIYPATDSTEPGWSFIQPITTSHITGHYFEKGINPNIHIDIYSCKKFNWKVIIKVIHQYLELLDWHANFIVRTNGLSQRKVWDISGNQGTTKKEIILQKNEIET